MNVKDVIITTGDITDADGFIAFAEYVKNSDADIIYILNYPAFLHYNSYKNVDNDKDDIYLGFTYGLGEYLEALKINIDNKKDVELNELYIKFLDEIKSIRKNNNIIITKFKNLYFQFTKYILFKIYNEIQIQKSKSERKIYILEDYIHKINPFSKNIIKCEFFVYKNLFKEMIIEREKKREELYTIEEDILNSGREEEEKIIHKSTLSSIILERKYSNIYIDGNGSFAFIDETIINFLKLYKAKIRGCFIQGGVLANIEPQTTSYIKNNIHRCGLSTMNQIYHIDGFMMFMDFCAENNINILFVPNNCIYESSTLLNDLNDEYLRSSNTLDTVCKLYYENGRKKPFDLITAKFITNAIKNGTQYFNDNSLKSKFIFSKPYGISLLCSSSILTQDEIYNLHENSFLYENLIRVKCFTPEEKKEKIKMSTLKLNVKSYDCFIGYTSNFDNYSKINCIVDTYENVCEILIKKLPSNKKINMYEEITKILLSSKTEDTKINIQEAIISKLKFLNTQLYTGGLKKKVIKKIKRLPK